MTTDFSRTDAFDRRWAERVTQVGWIKALYALIGLTRLGERPTTVRQLAAVLERPEDGAAKLAWKAARVRPENGRIHLDTIWPGALPRRRLHVGDREMPVSGCAPDLFSVAAVVDVPFWIEDSCPVTGTPIRIGFMPAGVERAAPLETVVAMLSPDQLRMIADMKIEQVNTGLCVQQPFFSSEQAAEEWLGSHPGGRVFPVQDMVHRTFFTHIRDIWRPRILANAA